MRAGDGDRRSLHLVVPFASRWAWAAIGLVALPLALATGSETRLGFTLPLSVTVSEVSVWVALALLVVA